MSGCSARKQSRQVSIDAIVKEKLGSDVVVAYNDSKEYALCQQKNKSSHALRSFKYIVIRVSDNVITNQGSFQNGYVRWLNENTIEVKSVGLDEKSKTELLKVGGQQS